MDREGVFITVVEVISRYIMDEQLLEGVDGRTRIIEDLDVNSARLIDVVLALEDEYEIEVDDSTINAIKTIDDAIDVILKKLDEK